MSNHTDALRILHLRSSSGFFGAEAVISSYFAALAGSAVEMELVLLTQQADHPLLRHIDAPVHLLPAPSGFSREVMQRLREITVAGGFRIVHSHDYKSDLYAVLLAKEGPKIMTTLHGWTRNSSRVRFYEWLDRRLLRRFDHIIAVSPELYRQAASLLGRAGRAHLLFNAIDTRRFAAERSTGSTGGVNLVSVGRLSPEKALHHLIAALAKLPAQTHLTIIGDGPLREPLQAQCRQLRLEDRVTFLGIRDDIPRLLAGMDVFVMPSLREGLPIALLEAMAAGCAPVASAVGAIPEVLDQGRAGVLVPPGQPEQLAAALTGLIANPGRIAALGSAAAERVRSRYDLSTLREQLLRLYLDAVPPLIPA
jgi:glycosyltransferase involved in cell wall biosynthesis